MTNITNPYLSAKAFAKKKTDIPVVLVCAIFAAKLANGIIDTPVLLAAKAHMRNQRPVIIGISTNDALGINFKNIGKLMNMKNIFFVPFGQDDFITKPNSLVCEKNLIIDTIESVLEGKQVQPVILGK